MTTCRPDWNSWSRERRAWAVRRAAAIPAAVILHRLGASIDQATAQATQRYRDPRSVYAHPVDREGNEHLASIMEPPSETEGLRALDGVEVNRSVEAVGRPAARGAAADHAVAVIRR